MLGKGRRVFNVWKSDCMNINEVLIKERLCSLSNFPIGVSILTRTVKSIRLISFASYMYVEQIAWPLIVNPLSFNSILFYVIIAPYGLTTAIKMGQHEKCLFSVH